MVRKLVVLMVGLALLGGFTVAEAYGQGETVLGAYFMNGNTDVFSSRIYLFNSSFNPGDVRVRVFTLPLTSGTTEELTTEPLALGTLGALSSFNIKLDVDILTPLGIPLPYTDNGGNLTLEFIIGAAGVQGVAQVFSGDFAFGTYPLQVISAGAANLVLRVKLTDTFDATNPAPLGGVAFYIGGVICADPTLSANCVSMGTFHCWGWTIGTVPGGNVVAQEWDLDGRGKIQVQGVEDGGPRAVTGGTGDFRNVRGEATGFDLSGPGDEFIGAFVLIGVLDS